MYQDRIALYRAEKDPNIATPMKPQPQRELLQLQNLFLRVKEAISRRAEGIGEIRAVYLFDEAEADRLDSNGQCCRFDDLTVTIGLFVGIMSDTEYATLVLIHEIAHLKYWEHSTAYHAYLDELIEIYNKATGSMIENDYVGQNDKR